MKHFILLVSLLLTVPVWAQNKVVVRVLDAQNAPVAGASVEVTIWRERSKPIPPQVTGADGAATFDYPAPIATKAVLGGASVTAPGFAFGNVALKGENVEIHLEPGATWRGKVLDDAGKPIAGAEVKVSGAMLAGDYQNMRRLYGEKSIAAYTSTTGDDGAFEVRDVPAKMELMWQIEHPDFALKNGNGTLAGADFSAKLVPGGGLRGRFLDLDGKALAGALVYASQGRYGGGNSSKTDEKGDFTIRSLAAGTYNVSAYFLAPDESRDFVLPRVQNVAVEVGKIADAPETRALAGVEIKGLVRDAKTKTALEGASVYAQNGDENGGSGETDAAGQFRFRVLAGNYKIYISGAPTGYIRPDAQQSVTIGETTPAELVFDLQKAVILRGKVVDEAGAPLKIKLKVDYDTSLESDAAGKWEFAPQNSKAIQIGGGDSDEAYYEVVSPLSIPLDTEAETTIILRAKPWQTLPGRVLSSDGTPLEGAQIEFDFYTLIGEGNGASSTSHRTALSNKNGDFTLPQIRDGLKTGYFNIKGKREGYAFQKGGELFKNGPVWQISDFVFMPLNLEISGRTAPGARVTAAGSEVTAGADGAFSFKGLPADARVWAFKDDQFGGGAAKMPLQIELKPQDLQARDPELARDIWRDIAAEAGRGKGQGYGSLPWISQHLAAEKDADANTRLAKATGDREIMTLGERVAATADGAALAAAFDRIAGKDMRLYAYLRAALKTTDKTFAMRALKEAEAGLDTPEKTEGFQEFNLYSAAAVAAKWDSEAAGFALLDRAIVQTLKLHPPKSTRGVGAFVAGQADVMAGSAELVAEGGAPLLRRLLAQIDPEEGFQVSALSRAIPALATSDMTAALSMLDELEKMPEPPTNGESRRSDLSPQYAFAQAASKIVPLLGAKSPEQALKLARRVRDENYGGTQKWSALAEAAKFQTGDTAAKLWREIVGGAGPAQAPRFAARAWEFDPKLGRELFAIAREKVETDRMNEWQARSLVGGYAFYSARANAAQARFLIEREWGAARGKKTEGDELGALALAMAPIDGNRAWQMAREIPLDDRFSSFDARRKIGMFLDASEEKRRDFPFETQGNWEEWRAFEGD